MSDSSLESQIDRILRDIRKSHSRNQPFYIEILADDKSTELNINCVPDGISWLIHATGCVTMNLTTVAHNEVVKVCSQLLRLAFDAKWRTKAELEFKKKAAN